MTTWALGMFLVVVGNVCIGFVFGWVARAMRAGELEREEFRP